MPLGPRGLSHMEMVTTIHCSFTTGQCWGGLHVWWSLQWLSYSHKEFRLRPGTYKTVPGVLKCHSRGHVSTFLLALSHRIMKSRWGNVSIRSRGLVKCCSKQCPFLFNTSKCDGTQCCLTLLEGPRGLFAVPLSLNFKISLFFVYVIISVCMHMCVLVPAEETRGCWIPWSCG